MSDIPTPTQEEILQSIKASRDSATLINRIIQELADGAEATRSMWEMLDCNVRHLEPFVVADIIVNSGEDISDLVAALEAGQAKLAEDIWPAE